MNKAHQLAVAELIDSYRVFPRAFFAAYFVFWCWITVTLLEWYVTLPAPQRTLEASGFGSAIFLTATAFLKQIYATYAETSRDWSQQAATSTTTVASTTTTSPQP